MRFIYVFGKEGRDRLLGMGFPLIREDQTRDCYVFENRADITLCFGCSNYVFSNTLTF